eukprot:2200567-Amphidinium_carterae.1
MTFLELVYARMTWRGEDYGSMHAMHNSGQAWKCSAMWLTTLMHCEEYKWARLLPPEHKGSSQDRLYSSASPFL